MLSCIMCLPDCPAHQHVRLDQLLLHLALHVPELILLAAQARPHERQLILLLDVVEHALEAPQLAQRAQGIPRAVDVAPALPFDMELAADPLV